MNRRQLFRNTFGLAGAAVVSPSILNEALPVARLRVEIFSEVGEWVQITGLDAIKSGQIYRFLWPETLGHKLIDEGFESSWFGVAAEDGAMMKNPETGQWVGAAMSDYFSEIEDALAHVEAAR